MYPLYCKCHQLSRECQPLLVNVMWVGFKYDEQRSSAILEWSPPLIFGVVNFRTNYAPLDECCVIQAQIWRARLLRATVSEYSSPPLFIYRKYTTSAGITIIIHEFFYR